MISIDELVDMVCTEAILYGGLQEVPDRADGTVEHYHDPKRNARAHHNEDGAQNTRGDLPPIRYELELIESEDGTLHWEE